MNSQKNTCNGLFVIAMVIVTAVFFSCHGGNDRTDLDTPEKGTIHISVDESFKPVIDSQIQVFEALNAGTKIIAEYKPEAECFKDLLKDSTRMIIVTRGLSDKEMQFYKDTLSFSLAWEKVANDAIAIIVNNSAKDSLFTMGELRGILNGSTGDKQVAVFDGLKETSIVRFAIDSILGGKPFDPKKVFAEKNSQAVIDYVSKHNDVIGLVGVEWIGNKEDTSQISFLKSVRIASIECSCPEKIVHKTLPGKYYEKEISLGTWFVLYPQGKL